MPTVNARSDARRVVAEQLAHPGADERGDEQDVGLVGHAGQDEDGRPALHAAGAEEHHRLAHRADPLRAGEQRRVGEPQELVAEADVADDRALDLLERDARLQVGERAELVEAAGRGGAAGDDLGLGDERALEGGEAEPAAERQVVGRRDGGGDEDEVAVAQRGDLLAQALGAVDREVELDAPRDVEQRLDRRAEGDVVEDDARAALGELVDGLEERLVVALDRGHLEHDAVGANRHRPDAEQKLAAERQPARRGRR